MRRRPLPALTLGRVLHLDPATRELHAEMVGLREVTSRSRGSALVEPTLLLDVRRRLAITRDQREHAEHAVDLVEQMLKGALCLGADGSGVERAVDVAQSGEDDAHR